MRLKIYNYIKYYGEEGKDKSFHVEIKPGYTCIVGPNGTGKTTMLEQIKDYCKSRNNEFIMLSYDNLRDGSNRQYGKFLDHGRFEMIANLTSSSEGEGIVINLGEFATSCGKATAKAIESNKKLVILLDGIDSGTSIDKIYSFKDYFVKTILDHCYSNGVEVYIISTANSYAMVEDGVDCIIASNARHRKFRGYKDFKRFILNNRKYKE